MGKHKTVETACVYCGKVFHTATLSNGEARGKYCSSTCKDLARGRRERLPFEAIIGEKWIQFGSSDLRTYFVSDLGRIKSVTKHNVERLIKPVPFTDNKGRRRFVVSIGKTKPGSGWVNIQEVPKLVAYTFVPNPFNCSRLTYLDGNRENFSAINLRWGEQ